MQFFIGFFEAWIGFPSPPLPFTFRLAGLIERNHKISNYHFPRYLPNVIFSQKRDTNNVKVANEKEKLHCQK